MKNLWVLLLILMLGLVTQTASGQSEKELVIKTARAMETAPLDKETIKMREHSLAWVIQTDQVNVVVCSVFTLFSDKKNKNSSDMTAGYTIGMAAFKLEFPDKASDEDAAQLAGLETALKVYEGIVKEKPKTKFDGVEALIVKRNNGELPALVATFNCGKK